jgi:phosphate starvation-inducible PhoH-like protein
MFFLMMSSFFIGSGGSRRGIFKMVHKTVKIDVFSKPIGVKQTDYCGFLNNSSVPLVVAVGSAGTGKTMFACEEFVRGYSRGQYKKLILTRPFVNCAGEDLGFLPGNIHKKMAPWTQPIYDILSMHYGRDEMVRMIEREIIDVVPLAFMRGRTFNDAFILADEMQNSLPSQMLMMLTRMGRNSKMAITGDLMQSDLKTEINGLQDLVIRCKKNVGISEIGIVELGSEDVQRSLFVRKIMGLYL